MDSRTRNILIGVVAVAVVGAAVYASILYRGVVSEDEYAPV